MKKITSLVAGLMLLFTGVNYAQSTTKTAAPAPKAKTEKKAATATPSKAAPAKEASSTTHTKKDGTPDKRYSENKTGGTKAPPAHTKKDGTPDKRYSENKTAAPAKK